MHGTSRGRLPVHPRPGFAASDDRPRSLVEEVDTPSPKAQVMRALLLDDPLKRPAPPPPPKVTLLGFYFTVWRTRLALRRRVP